jgi:peptidylprolyl isomerase
MSEVKSGDTVNIHYTGTLSDGTVFDSSEGREPLQCTVGAGQVSVGMDEEMPGMKPGEKKTIHIPCARAYGESSPDARQAIPRQGIPDDIPLEVGIQLQMQSPEGHILPVTIVEVDEATVTLDANHPLAGKDLTFEIELVSVNAPVAQQSEDSCSCC